ncbi:MAG: hypothetical protein COU10_03305 [Candidatus Harrisonbacteria bacterium CG10_big_fil_rev_8_21_14_0_10_45_28]|uniref:Nudix hydrolase domain-containing protein n=1 Tax=Candidatus Harrisonbacteria bacterium CG10_big_fil_rev_8_21_14_0_10_45_28 TaxID=1974586 RepID=A0A2H0UMR0_9BACT|nr:MAG: hypothetical protein COU10_03305 [Candidatus Harrisonbacteria bacterium CG10_big_fil_rev_8_21_14_0_10_45_28]
MTNEEQSLLENAWICLTETLAKQWARRGREGQKPMGLAAFNCLLQKMCGIACEIIPVRRRGKTIEMLFIPRSENDPTPGFAGRDHIPGEIVTPGESLELVRDRTLLQEIGATAEDICRMPWGGGETKRGTEYSLPRLVRLTSEPTLPHRWIDINKLEELARSDGLIVAQYESFVRQAVEWLQKLPGLVPEEFE